MLSHSSPTRAVVAALLLSAIASRADTMRYTITNLGTLGGTSSIAYGLNDRGQVVGESETVSGYPHAFLWTSGTGMQDLGTLAGHYSSTARGINSSGQVAGASGTFGSDRAFLWTSGTGMRDLGTHGTGNSRASAINDLGQVVGSSGGAFLWTSGTGMQDLDETGGGGRDINNRGEVVGYFWDTTWLHPVPHAFLWTSGSGLQDIGGFVGQFVGYGEALGVNDDGQVVGVVNAYAFLWTRGTGMQDLGTLIGDSWSIARAINDRGQVVGDSGTASTTDERRHAFLWTSGTGMQDLNALLPPNSGWVLSTAHDINNAGQIVGQGEYGGNVSAFLLTPTEVVPEPSTCALLGLGLAGLIWMRRRSTKLQTNCSQSSLEA